jgi:hypothetical protein
MPGPREERWARLVGLLRAQNQRLWGYHDWVNEHDCPTPRPEDGMEFARIVITRSLMHDGEDRHTTDATDGLALVEALGMLRLAEDTLIQNPPAEAEADEEPR